MASASPRARRSNASAQESVARSRRDSASVTTAPGGSRRTRRSRMSTARIVAHTAGTRRHRERQYQFCGGSYAFWPAGVPLMVSWELERGVLCVPDQKPLEGERLAMSGDWSRSSPGTSGPAPSDLDTSVPHIARVYDYWLGGKDN